MGTADLATANLADDNSANLADGDTAIFADDDTAGPVMVRWEGAQFLWHSLAHVNRELCLGLLEQGASGKASAQLEVPGEGSQDHTALQVSSVQLSLVPTEPSQFTPGDQARFAPLAVRFFAPLERPADIHVRHFFPPRFDAPRKDIWC